MAKEQARADVAAARQAWLEAQPDLDPEHLIFIDVNEPSWCRRFEPDGEC